MIFGLSVMASPLRGASIRERGLAALPLPLAIHLDQAVKLNPVLRFQARNDSDFQNLAEDPRFTEMLYPDPGGELPPISETSGE